MRGNFHGVKLFSNECSMFHKCKLRFAKWYNLYFGVVKNVCSNLNPKQFEKQKTILQNTHMKTWINANHWHTDF